MSLEEYYKHYLTLHQNKWCRRLHMIGQIFTIAFIFFCIQVNLFLLIFAPFVVYPFAWSGHYFFEKNEPAAFRDPLKAKVCDWIMFKDILIGRIEL